jgi:hypothetical protein
MDSLALLHPIRASSLLSSSRAPTRARLLHPTLGSRRRPMASSLLSSSQPHPTPRPTLSSSSLLSSQAGARLQVQQGQRQDMRVLRHHRGTQHPTVRLRHSSSRQVTRPTAPPRLSSSSRQVTRPTARPRLSSSSQAPTQVIRPLLRASRRAILSPRLLAGRLPRHRRPLPAASAARSLP